MTAKPVVERAARASSSARRGASSAREYAPVSGSMIPCCSSDTAVTSFWSAVVAHRQPAGGPEPSRPGARGVRSSPVAIGFGVITFRTHHVILGSESGPDRCETPRIGPDREGRTMSTWMRRSGLAGLGALAAALVVLGAACPAAAQASGPPDRATDHGKRQWRFDDTAATVSDVARVIGADRLWSAGITGSGVGVALIDTGVVPVAGLRADHVVNGPDLSLDSQTDEALYLDTFGHGTHLAGIITGSGGIAPGTTLPSGKAGAYDGAVDVSQVIAALDWVVAHRNDDPKRPIRVVNLSYGTDGVQDYQVDPLTHAVENAWRAGIVVVAAAGNGGSHTPPPTNPAHDPYGPAVRAAATDGPAGPGRGVLTAFSSRGDDSRRPDLVAPGKSIVSLR